MAVIGRNIVDIYPYKQYAYDADGNLIYRGRHKAVAASDDATDWLIDRYDYTSGEIVKHRTRTTSWTLRTSGWS